MLQPLMLHAAGLASAELHSLDDPPMVNPLQHVLINLKKQELGLCA
jgi:hypothetical protein